MQICSEKIYPKIWVKKICLGAVVFVVYFNDRIRLEAGSGGTPRRAAD